MKRDKQEGPRYPGPSCLRPCCTFTPACRCRIPPALTAVAIFEGDAPFVLLGFPTDDVCVDDFSISVLAVSHHATSEGTASPEAASMNVIVDGGS